MLITIQNIDWAILHKIRAALSCRALDFIMPRITLLGNGGAFWIIAGFALLLILSGLIPLVRELKKQKGVLDECLDQQKQAEQSDKD